jgi:hypothetical protein
LRSLADFAKIVGVLDARNASFVSVTQYQDYSGDHKNRKYAAVSRGFVADEPVSGEPVCGADSLLTGKITGNFTKIGPFGEKLSART